MTVLAVPLLLLLSLYFPLQETARVPESAKRIEMQSWIEATDQAVSALLNTLSQECKIPLRAQKATGDYRISAFTQSLPLPRLMDDLGYLLDHGDSPVGFYWKVDERDEKGYLLNRTSRSLNRERQMPEEVRRRAGQWLQELWQAFNLKGDARRKAAEKADSPYFGAEKPEGATQTAFSQLTESEVSSLISNGVVEVSLSRLPVNIADTVRSRSTRQDSDIPGDSPQDELRVFLTFDASKESLDRGTFSTTLGTTPKGQNPRYGMGIDPLGIIARVGEKSAAKFLDEDTPSPEVDVTNALKNAADPYDLNTRLKAIAHSAKVNIYCEYFPIVSWNSFGRAPGFRFSSKAPLNVLLNEVAQRYHYDVVRRGDSYFLWSRIWFLERSNVIPETLLSDWRATRDKGGPFRFDQILAMSPLSDGQLAMLERMVYPVGLGPRAQMTPRLVRILTASQRQQAFSDKGLSLNTLAPQQLQEWQRLTAQDTRWHLSPTEPRVLSIRMRESKDLRPYVEFILSDAEGKTKVTDEILLWTRRPKPK